MQYSYYLAGLGVLYVVVRLLQSFIRSRRHRAFAKAHECQPVFTLPHKAFGIDKWTDMLAADKIGQTIQVLANRYNHGATTWQSPFMWNTLMQTIEPENLKSILATNFKDWSLGKRRHDTFWPLLGDGIFTLDGQGWEHSRALLRPQFARDQISDLNALEAHVQRLLSHFPSNGQAIDLQPLFYCLTLDSATEFLFGESVDSLLSPTQSTTNTFDSKKGDLTFAEAFNSAQHWLVWSFRFQHLYWITHTRAFWKPIKQVHRFVDYFVDLALHPEKRHTSTKNKYVFLEQLVLQTRDPKALRDQMLNILLAGRDTTASLLGWAFYLLARDPRVYQKLRAEVIAAFGTDRDGNGVKPTWAGLKELVYLRYVINEVLRLYPSVPINFRVARCDTTLPVGGGPDGLSPVFVPKGQGIGYMVYALHRRKDIYGQDADEFRPERWGEGTKIGRGWEYLPFNGGPRICLGQQYALTEASYTIIRICQHFESIEPSDPRAPLQADANLTMAPKNCLVKLHAA